MVVTGAQTELVPGLHVRREGLAGKRLVAGQTQYYREPKLIAERTGNRDGHAVKDRTI